MDSTVNQVDDQYSSLDDENDDHCLGAALVSSTVSQDLTGLDICFDVDTASVLTATSSIDEDVLSVCANEEDTKFVDELLSSAPKVEIPVRSGKRKRETNEFTEFTAPSPVRKSKRKKTNRTVSQPEKKSTLKMSVHWRATKSLVLPNERVVQMCEISSTKSDLCESEEPVVPCKLSDLFESKDTKKIAQIFGNPCLKFLNGECDDEKCIHGHELPDPKELRKRLNELSIDEVRIALNSHVRSFERLVERYFCTFTEYFGENCHKAELIEMMTICKSSSGHLESNCVHVMDGLVQLGMSYSHALVLVLNAHNELTDKAMFVLTTLITDKRNDNVNRFLNDLQSFYLKKFRFNPVIIDRLMHICLDLPYDTKWFTFVKKVVNEWTNIDELNSNLVYDFCSMTPRRAEIIRKHRLNLN